MVRTLGWIVKLEGSSDGVFKGLRLKMRGGRARQRVGQFLELFLSSYVSGTDAS